MWQVATLRCTNDAQPPWDSGPAPAPPADTRPAYPNHKLKLISRRLIRSGLRASVTVVSSYATRRVVL